MEENDLYEKLNDLLAKAENDPHDKSDIRHPQLA